MYITEINREEHNKRKIAREGSKTMSLTSFHFSVLSFIPSDQKEHFWGKKVYLVHYYYRKFQKESFDSLILLKQSITLS